MAVPGWPAHSVGLGPPGASARAQSFLTPRSPAALPSGLAVDALGGAEGRVWGNEVGGWREGREG